MVNAVKIGGLFLGALVMAAPTIRAEARFVFSPEDRERVQQYWSSKAKYEVLPLPDVDEKGPFRARLSVEASEWLWNYNKQVRPGKLAPNKDPKALNAEQAKWDKWIDSRYEWDLWNAETNAAARSSKATGRSFTNSDRKPPQPAQMPAELKKMAGAPPIMVEVVQPKQHRVTFHDGLQLAYNSHVSVRPKYIYYRSHNGVMSGGVRIREISDSDLRSLFDQAGISKPEENVFRAVSLLEGGFDSLNTYDTGYVSVGFIQFACLKDGAGSLGAVLKRYKDQSFSDFDANFRTMGIDVNEGGRLVAIDPETGMEFVGADAARKIINDRRLAAVFQRAGRVSNPFRVAQLQIAKEMYLPSDDLVTATLGDGSTQTAKVRDLFRTEAGLATLMDRKVNTGKLGDLDELVSDIMIQFGLKDIREVAAYEFEMTRMLAWRKDYLVDLTLSKPRPSGSEVYRGGTRKGRSGSKG